MRSLQIVTSALAFLASAALLGAGCASLDQPSSAGDGAVAEPVVGSELKEVASNVDWRTVRVSAARFHGGGGGGGTNPCALLEDGAYCGNNRVKGNPDTLYRCQGGVRSVISVCVNGCEVMPPGTPDRCII